MAVAKCFSLAVLHLILFHYQADCKGIYSSVRPFAKLSQVPGDCAEEVGSELQTLEVSLGLIIRMIANDGIGYG